LYTAGVILLIYFIATSGNNWMLEGGSNVYSKFGAGYNSVHNVYLMFFLNFSWVQTLVLLIYIFKKNFIDTKNSECRQLIKKDIISTIFMTGELYVLFYIIFETYLLPRYVVAIVFFNSFFFFLVVESLFKLKAIRILTLILFFLFSFFSIFITFDPVSLFIFDDFKYGNNILIRDWGSTIVSSLRLDATIYSAQYTYQTKLTNKIFETIELKQEDTIIFFDTERPETGIGKEYDEYFPPNRIDTTTSTFTRKSENSFYPNVNFLSSKAPDFNLLFSLNNAYYITTLWEENEEECVKILSEVFDIVEKYEAEIDGYSMRAYKLRAKEKNTEQNQDLYFETASNSIYHFKLDEGNVYNYSENKFVGIKRETGTGNKFYQLGTIEMPSEFTIQLLIEPNDDLPISSYIIGNLGFTFGNEGIDGFSVQQDAFNGNRYNFTIATWSGPQTLSFELEPNKVNRISITMDKNMHLKVYVDNNLQSSLSLAGFGVRTASRLPFYIGGNNSNSNNYFNGTVYEVQILSEALNIG
jgi:hypothetical protein